MADKKQVANDRDGYYEQFMRDVIQDFNDRVLCVQKKAEEGTRGRYLCSGKG